MFEKLGVIGVLFLLFNQAPSENHDLGDRVVEKSTIIIAEAPIQSQETLSKEKVGKKYKDINVHITYYTNIDDALQGGHNDRKGVPLVSHNEPIVAMPADVPYGSYLEIDGVDTYKVVDTGGAIQWTDSKTCNVDVFIPNVSYDWIIQNTDNFTATARLYYNDSIEI